VYCFSWIQKNKSEKANQPDNTVLINIFGKFFKWANRFYMLPVWLDAKIMPRSSSAVLLIKAEKEVTIQPQTCVFGVFIQMNADRFF